MLKDVTLGQFYSVDSIIHKIDPRVKIRFTIAYIILLMLDRNVILFSFMSAIFLGLILASRIPLKHMIRGTKSVIIFLIICSAINIFTTMGDALVEIGFIKITDAGLIKFGFVFWRMLLLIFVASILTYTTRPAQLTDGLEKCFHLNGNVAMGITIAIRFIPVLFEELDRIMKAQQMRGARFNEGGPIKRIKAFKTVIGPLFQNSIDRAGNLADAMESRCYTGGKGRTKLKPLKYASVDYICYIGTVGMIVVAVFLIIKF